MERIGMKFNNCLLRNELKEGLLQYERDTNISPHFLVESLIENFLIKEEYLIVGAGEGDVPFPTELNQPKIRYANRTPNGKFEIRKTKGGKNLHFGRFNYNDSKIVVEFLESKNWDSKYSTSQTQLKGKKQSDFLFKEIEKENELKETE